uniref:Matrix metalloproteinase-25-like n=1 Tax=Diabrotica virgifera virgifera TaxID=50390 RepID=A0A6P7F8V5_DIAVI
MSLLYFIVLFCFLNHCYCAPTHKSREVPSVKALEFMTRYGYIKMDTGDSEALYTEGGISEIIKVMQRFGGIEETGEFDDATKRRNSVSIVLSLANWSPALGEATVQKHIQKALDTWGGYGRLNFFRSPSQNADIIVQFAQGYHGDRFPFDGRSGILAHAFFPHEQDHLGGDIHFDADEIWIDKSQKDYDEDGTDFYFVALHELGHSLGLAHSPVRSSIMFPYYQDSGSPPQLGYDDILAMYDLYIRRTLKEDTVITTNNLNGDTSTTTLTTPSTTSWSTEQTHYTSTDTDKSTRDQRYPDYKEYDSEEVTSSRTTLQTETSTAATWTTATSTKTPEYDDDYEEEVYKNDIPNTDARKIPDICDGHVDAIANLRDELFVFRDQYIWRFSERGVLVDGFPITIQDMFPNLPDSVTKVDAAYQRPDGMILIFTGDKFWIHTGNNFLSRSPEPLTHLGLPEYVTKIDAVQNWKRNKKTYFYGMDRFWRYNETSREIDPGYPQHMHRWRGVPSYLDAAITWKDGFTYFFRGGLFWKFDNDWIMATDDSPMPTPTYWFGCPEKNNIVLSWFLRDP